jgi:hypothetical protein
MERLYPDTLPRALQREQRRLVLDLELRIPIRIVKFVWGFHLCHTSL